ncbi:MAG: 4-hydroxy-tetrahydrodipicolinate synthase [Clostridia bacterium]|nr:4-hydroxy-tetrahydrodipicolinate synthase [Clostridia bacterium]
MKKTIFQGVATALITPLTENGIDYDAFGRLIDWQIESGINALVICGTTGECATLTEQEHADAIAFAVKRVNKRVPVIAGTGSNDVAFAIWLTQEAEKAGADAALVVTPYYNKTTQRGLVKMFEAIADSTNLPLILYNVPSRTGINIEPDTYVALSKHPNIVAIKEANGNISKMVETVSKVGGDLDLYSGNDDQIVPILALGGKGVISVLSNVCPKETVELCDRFFAGDLKGSMALQAKYNEFISLLFCETNPIPVKAAMAKLDWCEDYLRLPLVPMEDNHREKMFAEMKKLGIID